MASSRSHALKSVPLLTEALITRLEATTATPATFKGKPIATEYVFNFKFAPEVAASGEATPKPAPPC